jgi:hypothetical protein
MVVESGTRLIKGNTAECFTDKASMLVVSGCRLEPFTFTPFKFLAPVPLNYVRDRPSRALSCRVFAWQPMTLAANISPLPSLAALSQKRMSVLWWLRGMDD